MKISGISDDLSIAASGKCCETFEYAISELERMLRKAGAETTSQGCEDSPSTQFKVTIGSIPNDNACDSQISEIQYDGFIIDSQADSVTLTANSAKGALNAVYELMERLGYLYLFPTDEGEWAPQELSDLTNGISIVNPRFPHRGVFREEVLATPSHNSEEWFEFFAKLRFNSVVLDRPDLLPLAEKLGLRMEIGGHGFSKLLPRELFDDNPELFRMFQPEDFNGRRLSDSNLCVTNPATKQIVLDNFDKKLEESKDAYAMHLWPDDLPAGGWCMCPSCRAFSPEDQAMIAMRMVADEAKSVGSDIKIPFLAYHDTMTPGPEIDAADNMFLLYAPRERCYAHALDDPNCARNRFYMGALVQWMEKFKGIDDNHTFEYYFDQILFRGMHPYIPAIIAGDITAYEKAGIECNLSLQVAADSVAPEYNMLFFAASHWAENSLSPEEFSANLAGKVDNPEIAATMSRYLNERAEVYSNAMRMCDHNVKIYLDYRWLPETNSPFGREMSDAYLEAFEKLTELSAELAQTESKSTSPRTKKLLKQESLRLAFEIAEFKVMHHQQLAVNNFAEYQNNGDESAKTEGIKQMESAILALETSLEKANACGFDPQGWYTRNINTWLTKEFKAKIAKLQTKKST